MPGHTPNQLPLCAGCPVQRELEDERRAAALNIEELEERIEELERELEKEIYL